MLFQKLLGAVSAPLVTFSHNGYQHIDSPTLTSGTYTFSGQSFGASGSKVVAIYASGASVGVADSSVSCSIAGVSATVATSAYDAFHTRWNYLFFASVNNASGSVVLTFTGFTPNNIFISCASVFNASNITPTIALANTTKINNSGVAPALTLNTTHTVTGVVFAGYSAGGVSAGTTDTWTGISETTSFYLPARTTQYTDAVSLESAGTVSATLSDSAVNRPGLVLAVWK